MKNSLIKQHISFEQWTQFASENYKDYEQVRTWIENKRKEDINSSELGLLSVDEGGAISEVPESYWKFMTIGRMMQFLLENSKSNLDNEFNDWLDIGGELCDRLWDAIKFIYE